MRVVVTGATGNVGTALLRALNADPDVDHVVAVARRRPIRSLSPAEFVSADVSTDHLEPIFAGADAVVHLAWLIQPGRDESVTRAVNLNGSRRVFDAVVTARVPSLVYASSVGAYSPGPKDRLVDESWPTGGIPSSFYSRHKAAVEGDLDRLAAEQPWLRIVRLRPGLIFQRSAATEIRRLFLGPLLPGALLRSSLAPISPDIPGLRFQAVHSDDVADAYRRAVLSDVSGALNVAADPVIGTAELSQLLDARPVRIPARIVRGAAAATFALRLQPAEPGWIDMALGVPLMSVERARGELGWSPRHSSTDAVEELVAGLRDAADDQTAPLARTTSGPARVRELLTGIGKRQ
jgi:UDP-glucose 4-epimerase